MNIEEALAIFEIDPQRDILSRVWSELDIEPVRLAIVKRCCDLYRERILKAHPDAGGKHEEAARLNEAMDLVRKIEIKVQSRLPVLFYLFEYADATTTSMNWRSTTNA